MTSVGSADGDWAPRLRPHAQFGESPDLGPRLRAFHAWQVERWPRLRDSLEALGAVRTREIPVGERPVTLQWNPGRVASTTAKVDAASLEARACFLCPDNLPPEEFGLSFGDDLVLLANPAPIVPLHLVAAHRGHRAQELEPVLEAAVDLASATAGHLTVFYNGPRCGASAPDHIHLQAVETGWLPDEALLEPGAAGSARGGRRLVEGPALEVVALRGSSRVLAVMRGSRDGVIRGVRTAMDALGAVTDPADEPPVNLLLAGVDDGVSAMFYPRGAHRPACYTAEGPGQRLISPGALDMAGLVITVREQDYLAVDESTLAGIFEETSLDPGRADRFEAELERRLDHG